MSYFSRLTDIVTCNLSEILAKEADPRAAIEQILFEIHEGVAGAERSLNTARKNSAAIAQEIADHRTQAERWAAQAREALVRGAEDAARKALVRKSEQTDLVAGLEQQLESARHLVEHLTTMHRALEARLADAHRKRKELLGEDATAASPSAEDSQERTADFGRYRDVEDELAALKRELGQE